MNWDKWLPIIIVVGIVALIISLVGAGIVDDYFKHQEKMIKLQKCRGL